MNDSILTINCGSSSLKFSVYGRDLSKLFRGSMEFNEEGGTLLLFSGDSPAPSEFNLKRNPGRTAEGLFIEWIDTQSFVSSIAAVGHRVVHGMNRDLPERVTAELIEELKKIKSFDPQHLERAVNMIELFRFQFPDWISVACFDTAFHSTIPRFAKMLPLPRRYFDKGIRRYGFHGISYSYLMAQLENIAGSDIANGKIILAHLGSGSSFAAVENSKCIDTSMGFTPASGIVMSTRTGDLDPGVIYYLLDQEKLNAAQFNDLVNNQSGLLGISETSGSIRQLLETKASDSRAAEAVTIFCYQTKKWIGSYAAALGGLDTLVFSGGIGEHSPEVRERACAGLSFLGIALDTVRNQNNDAIISSVSSRVTVRVIPTNEELMIAKMTAEFQQKN